MSDRLVAAIDATLDEMCACGCGKPLPRGGPSAWFATELCQQRWAKHRKAVPASPCAIAASPPDLAAAFQAVTDFSERAMQAAGRLIGNLVTWMEKDHLAEGQQRHASSMGWRLCDGPHDTKRCERCGAAT